MACCNPFYMLIQSPVIRPFTCAKGQRPMGERLGDTQQAPLYPNVASLRTTNRTSSGRLTSRDFSVVDVDTMRELQNMK